MKSEILEKGCQQLGLSMSEHQEQQFMKYYELLIEWNKVMNLTAITEFDEVMQKHFLDSLTIVKGIEKTEHICVLDVGTGAGFPGIPLKIMFPEWEIVLLDSLNKRIKFLDEAIAQLGLEKIRTIHGRAEDFAKKQEYREQFDLVVSRAVANLASLSEYCLPYVREGGKFVSYKAANADAELDESGKAIDILGGKIDKVEKFQIPDTDMDRTLVVVKKIRKTPGKYPRKAGMPGKEPLK
ncbi:MAG: 16S rRNA (guanine(527)-N(7))-methyltransferase RsmG [Lachnospiraceae bacterium]|nr:16S rRNA (guanine(527)-N(7))-methyltransferase RsmG [Lachnospiraceae bacterium]